MSKNSGNKSFILIHPQSLQKGFLHMVMTACRIYQKILLKKRLHLTSTFWNVRIRSKYYSGIRKIWEIYLNMLFILF